MRDLLVEIRDLLAEGAEQEGQAQEERGTGVETGPYFVSPSRNYPARFLLIGSRARFRLF
jgi:hypothetical protein